MALKLTNKSDHLLKLLRNNYINMVDNKKSQYNNELYVNILYDLGFSYSKVYQEEFDVDISQRTPESCGTSLIETKKMFKHRISSHIPDKINKFIKDNTCKIFKYQDDLLGNKVIIHIYDFIEAIDQKQYNSYIHNILGWLLYIYKFIKIENCNEVISINLYLTPFQKRIPSPNEELSRNHINTAFTQNCKKTNSIVIFRKEDWFKTFIHETFHFFNMDGSQTNMDLSEAYSEFWATCINIFIMQLNINTDNKYTLGHYPKEDMHIFHDLIDFEVYFSVLQAIKINKNFDVSICETVNTKDNNLVKYYYLYKSVLLIKYIDFINWCSINNKKHYMYLDESNIEKFKEFVNINDMELCNRIKKVGSIYKTLLNKSNTLKNTLKMNLFEVSI